MRCSYLLPALLLLCLAVPALHAQEVTLEGSLEGLRAAVTAGDVATSTARAQAILDLAAKRDMATLNGIELYTIGAAQYVLAAATMQQALQKGGLDLDMQRNARNVAMLLDRQGLVPEQPAVATAPAGVIVIGKGEQVTLDDYLVAGKTTIVDFYSEYCGPCRTLAPRLEALVNQRDDIAVVKVDINRPGITGIDSQSPVARQFNLRSIPHLRVYGPDKQLQLEGEPAFRKVMEWCQAAE